MHQYINEMKEHEFVLWVIGANAKDKGKLNKIAAQWPAKAVA